jgi:hypothetical protein
MANWWDTAPVVPAGPSGKAWWEAAPVAGEEPSGRSFEDTALIRGLQSFGSFLADPAAPIRRFVSPSLAAIEDEQNRQAVVPPPAEIIRRAGDAAFPAFGVKEYRAGDFGSGLGQAATTGAVAGAPLGGPVGAILGAAGGAAGYTARQALGEPKEGEPDWTTRAEILASMLPGGIANRMGVRTRTRESPPPSPGTSWSPRTFPPSETAAAGVNPTFGQAMGGIFNRLEQGLSSVPFLGDFMRTGRAGAVEEFNRGAINRALGHIDEQLDPNTPLGRQAIAEADTRVGARYDQITPQLTMTLDPQFGTGLTDIFRRSTMLSRDLRDQFVNTFRTEVMDRLNGPNITGQAFRDAESTLGQIARQYRHSPLPADRNFGNLVTDLQGELRGNLRRSNPGQAAELGDIHRAYTDLARVELAAARMGTGLGGISEYGVFTPPQLTSAIRQMDPSLRGRAFARGVAPGGQAYAETGQRLLGNTVPDSGTPYRSLAALLAGGGVAGAFDPVTAATGVGAGMGLGALYSPQGRAAINYFLRRPEQAGLAGLLAGQDDNLLPPLR